MWGAAWVLGMTAVVSAGPNSERIDSMQKAWAEVDAYCSDFVLGFHGGSGSALSMGKSCWEKSGRIRTDTRSTLGDIVEIRSERELWYYNPAQPVVLHVTASQDFGVDTRQVGRGVGELVDLVSSSPDVRQMPSAEVDGRETWLFRVPKDSDTEVIVFVDARSRLPVALELRQGGHAVMSYGFMNLKTNPALPASFFSIEALPDHQVVKLDLDPRYSSPEDLARKLSGWRSQ